MWFYFALCPNNGHLGKLLIEDKVEMMFRFLELAYCLIYTLSDCSLSPQAGDCRPRSIRLWPESTCCLSAPPSPPAEVKISKFSCVYWTYTSHREALHCLQPNILAMIYFTIMYGIEQELKSTQITSCTIPWLFSTLGEAESSFLEAEHVLEELHQHGGINQEEKMKTALEISTSLSRFSSAKTMFLAAAVQSRYIAKIEKWEIYKYLQPIVIAAEPNNFLRYCRLKGARSF